MEISDVSSFLKYFEFNIYFRCCDFFVIWNNYFNGINTIFPSTKRLIAITLPIVPLTSPKVTSMFRRIITLALILFAIILSMPLYETLSSLSSKILCTLFFIAGVQSTSSSAISTISSLILLSLIHH